MTPCHRGNLLAKLPALLLITSILIAACSVSGNPTPSGQGGAGLPTPEPAAADPRLLLPDLQPEPPWGLYVQTSADTDEPELRFGTTVVNIGRGPLDLVGAYDPSLNRTVVAQLIHTTDGEPLSRLAGSFVFHPGHNHWHFEDFFVFELWTYQPDGALDALLATTGKLTFCIFDTQPWIEDAATPRRAVYAECGEDFQGISVGWADEYAPALIGQQVDLTGVPDGPYALRTIADPDNRLQESREDNNANLVYVELTGYVVTLLDGP